MKRRAIVAGLAALLLVASGLVHAAFACSAALHRGAVADAAAHASHHDCRDRSAPPCCRQPATTVVLQQKADRLAGGAGTTLVIVAVARWRPAPALDPPARTTVMPSPPARAADPRLRLVSLLL